MIVLSIIADTFHEWEIVKMRIACCGWYGFCASEGAGWGSVAFFASLIPQFVLRF